MRIGFYQILHLLIRQGSTKNSRNHRYFTAIQGGLPRLPGWRFYKPTNITARGHIPTYGGWNPIVILNNKPTCNPQVEAEGNDCSISEPRLTAMEGLGIVTSGTMPAGTQSTCGGIIQGLRGSWGPGGSAQKVYRLQTWWSWPAKNWVGEVVPEQEWA